MTDATPEQVHKRRRRGRKRSSSPGSAAAPGDEGTTATPRADEGTTATPRADDGTTATPRADDGTAATPHADEGATATPRAEEGREAQGGGQGGGQGVQPRAVDQERDEPSGRPHGVVGSDQGGGGVDKSAAQPGQDRGQRQPAGGDREWPPRRQQRPRPPGDDRSTQGAQSGSTGGSNRGPDGRDGAAGGDNRAPAQRNRPRGHRPSTKNRGHGGTWTGSAGQAPAGGGVEQVVTGFLELLPSGSGAVRPAAQASPSDAVVPVSMVRALGLRAGDLVEARAKGVTVIDVQAVNGGPLEGLAARPQFASLTAVHPNQAITLGARPNLVTGRILDIIAPVGRGQRGLIVAPPKAGKTTLLHDIAVGVGHDPDLTLISCLVAERPEEVTEFRRGVPGTILAADLDMPPEAHIRVAALGVEHAKRLVEGGGHVVVLLDSLTRLARAHNLALRGSSRTLSGGMDAAALQPVRQVFGAARAAEEGGSLTIMATCLIDTGSKMDDVVYEEFKGTGNMEVVLDRGLAERRLFPAIDIERSGTRREDLLLTPEMLRYVTEIRRQMAGAPTDQALSALLDALRREAEGRA